MTGWLIYHPARRVTDFGPVRVYHDQCVHNQDPYVWSESFLHTYCHITQMRPEVGDIEFWVSGNQWPDFDSLWCDLVFVIKEKTYWEQANFIDRANSLVDADEAFNDHYRWCEDHPFARRRRYTLKADPDASFQPLDVASRLLDIVPPMRDSGVPISDLRSRLKSGFASRPMALAPDVAQGLSAWLRGTSAVRLFGPELRALRLNSPRLASP